MADMIGLGLSGSGSTERQPEGKWKPFAGLIATRRLRKAGYNVVGGKNGWTATKGEHHIDHHPGRGGLYFNLFKNDETAKDIAYRFGVRVYEDRQLGE